MAIHLPGWFCGSQGRPGPALLPLVRRDGLLPPFQGVDCKPAATVGSGAFLRVMIQRRWSGCLVEELLVKPFPEPLIADLEDQLA